MATLHQIQVHPEYVSGCFGCKVSTQRIGYCGKGGQDATAQKQWDKELDSYKSAVAAGIQPESTRGPAIRAAVEWSNKTGKPYSEDKKLAHDTVQVLERYAV